MTFSDLIFQDIEFPFCFVFFLADLMIILQGRRTNSLTYLTWPQACFTQRFPILKNWDRIPWGKTPHFNWHTPAIESVTTLQFLNIWKDFRIAIVFLVNDWIVLVVLE